MELSVSGLTKWCRRPRRALEPTPALLRDVSLRAASEALTMVTGPAGAGKSVLLRCLAGLEQVDSGEIRLDGQRIDHLSVADRQVALIGRDHALWPHLSVYRNIAAGLVFRRGLHPGVSRATDGSGSTASVDLETDVRRWAEVTGVTRLLDRYPDELTAAEAFRVALARSLASRPRILLLDDPLADLPPESRQETVTLVRDLVRRQRELEREMVVVWAVRDVMSALAFADQVAFLAVGQLLQEGAPEALYTNPLHLAVARALGPLPPNIIEARVVSAASPGTSSTGLRVPALHEWELPLAPAEAAGIGEWAAGEGKGRDVVLACLRPENILVGSDSMGFPPGSTVTPRFEVLDSQFLGWCRLVELRPVAGEAETVKLRIRVVVPISVQLPGDSEYVLAWSPEHLHLFDPVSEKRIGG